MSGSESAKLPFLEFIDDYFVECDEHLTVARVSLLTLESSVDHDEIDRSSLDELFRSFHSIKGLSAMVGLREAEQLAHQMESYLSALRAEQLRLTTFGVDALIGGVKTLEQVIAARRAQTQLPDIGPILDVLKILVPVGARESPIPAPPAPVAAAKSGTVELSPEKRRALASALSTGARAWRITFVPSTALSARGVNVNTVRQRLQEAGELIHAAPLVFPGGEIAFEFLLASSLEPSTFDAWREDGITWAAYETPAPAERATENARLMSVPSAATASLMHSNVVRVDLARLDDLMRMVGELVIIRARLDDNLRRLGSVVPTSEMRSLQETNQAIERQLRDLREGVMRVRLVPIREVFARMQFVVRDLTREHGKKIALTLSGQETEIDKLVVERMMDPLLHLVRNAVSHGIETPDDRSAAGKPPEGRIALRATTTGETITLEVEDDGRGIDAAAVMARARGAGLVGVGAVPDGATLLDILCSAGFSTREEADRVSGRGVGMSVVRTAVEELGGVLSLDSRAGKGTTFTIQLPLTLAIADALIVTVSGQTFAVPQVAVREVIQIEPTSLKVLENNELLAYREGVLPLLRLARVFRLAEPTNGSVCILVIGSGIGAIGVVVERVLGLREIVVRPLTDVLIRVPGIAGATELGDGRVVLILDAMALSRTARSRSRVERPRSESRASTVVPVRGVKA